MICQLSCAPSELLVLLLLELLLELPILLLLELPLPELPVWLDVVVAGVAGDTLGATVLVVALSSPDTLTLQPWVPAAGAGTLSEGAAGGRLTLLAAIHTPLPLLPPAASGGHCCAQCHPKGR